MTIRQFMENGGGTVETEGDKNTTNAFFHKTNPYRKLIIHQYS